MTDQLCPLHPQADLRTCALCILKLIYALVRNGNAPLLPPHYLYLT